MKKAFIHTVINRPALAVLLLILCFAVRIKAAGPDISQTWHKANIAFQQQQYDSAIVLYENICKTGRDDPKVYYNLGNAYYKKGNYPLAILNFERALQKDPQDDDIRFNLQLANLHTVDKIDPVPDIFYKRWLHALAASLPTFSWSVLLIIAFWLTIAALYFFVSGNNAVVRKTGFFASLSGTILFLLLLFIARESYFVTELEQKAIIITPSVYVKSSPDENGNDLFIIHEGTKVEILDGLNDWKKIRLANGSIGWLKGQEVETI